MRGRSSSGSLARSMATPTQLDRIEALLVKLELEQRQELGLLTSLVAGAQIMSQNITDLAAQIDAALNIVSDKLADESTKLDAESQAIEDVATVVASLRDQLATQGVPQAVLDQLANAATRLGAAATTIDASTTTIDGQAAHLQTIAADPANPAPPAPTPAA